MKAILAQNMVHAGGGSNVLGNAINSLTETLVRNRNRALDEDSRLRIAQGISDMGTARDTNAAINRVVVKHATEQIEHHFKTATVRDNLRSQTDEGVHRTSLLEKSAGLQPTGGLSVLVGGGLLQGQMQAEPFRDSAIAKGQSYNAQTPKAETPTPTPATSHSKGPQWTQMSFGDDGPDSVEKTIKGSPSAKRRVDHFGEVGNV